MAMDERVPGSDHYDRAYLSNGRPYSLAVQWDAVMEVAPASVLEIGVGTGISAFALRRAGITVTTLDVQAALSPDIVGDVRRIPLSDGAVDVTCCCQVLEHLPHVDFPAAVQEIRRVTRRRLVLSLPDITRTMGVDLRVSARGLWGVRVVAPGTRAKPRLACGASADHGALLGDRSRRHPCARYPERASPPRVRQRAKPACARAPVASVLHRGHRLISAGDHRVATRTASRAANPSTTPRGCARRGRSGRQGCVHVRA